MDQHERVHIGIWLLWVVVPAVALLRELRVHAPGGSPS